MKRLRIVSSLVSAIFLTACENGVHLSPITPSDTGVFDNNTTQDTVYKWSPYVGIHATNEATDAYRDALILLKRAGNIKGVRVGIDKEGGQRLSNPIIRMVGSLGGIDILGLIDNYYLINNPNMEQDIDQIFAAYPEIHYFQVGNEFTTIVSGNGGPAVTIEQYMTSLKRIYDHIQNRLPNRAVLLTQATLGSGLHGPVELEKMAKLGLTQMDPNKIIIAINSYDPNGSSEYTGILSGLLGRYRVWVTEAGISNPNLHISYVQNNYGKGGPFQNYLRAERVYWFIMWGGDGPPDVDFSLIKNPRNFPNYWKSPLLQLLTGSR